MLTICRPRVRDDATAGSGVGPSWLRRICALSVVGAAVAMLAGVGAAIGIVGVAALAPLVLRRHHRRVSNQRFVADVASVLELAARSVRSGESVQEAVVESARIAGGAAEAAIHIALGKTERSRREPTRHIPERVSRQLVSGGRSHQTQANAVLTAVLAMSGGSAGGGARGLEAGAALLRDHERARLEVTAGASHARASANLLVAVPIVFAAASLVLMPATATASMLHPLVILAVVVGLLLEVSGAWWTRRMVRSLNGDSK